MRESIWIQAPRIRRCGRGYSAEGPGFFVWDPDPTAVANAAILLARGAVPAARMPERLLVLDGARGVGSADPEALDA